MIALTKIFTAAVLLIAAGAGGARAADIDSRVTHGYADSNGVKIHYASLGSGPLVVMIHGFPDYWYTWRQQMEGLADRFQVVAIDQRGYNLSDKPAGVENYDVRLLVGDVLAVIKHLGQQKAIIVGHDWGGVVAWQLAINVPQAVERLIILNLPHPRGLSRELAHNPEQQQNSAYARRFQAEGAEKALTADGLAAWVKDPDAKKKYVEAFGRSDFGAMLNYYKRNYPREPYTEDLAAEEGSVLGADDPWAWGHGAAGAGAERDVGLGGQRFDDHHHSRCRAFRPGRRAGTRHQDDACVAAAIADGLRHVAICSDNWPMTAGIRELKDNLSEYVRRVEAGERVAVTAHGRVVAMRVPADEASRGRGRTRLEEMIADGRARPPLEHGDLLQGWPQSRIRLPKGTAAALIDADREED